MAGLQSVLKTVSVLEAILRLNESRVSVSEISQTLGWSRAATHQYLSSLLAAGWLQQTAGRKYELTAQAAVFGRFAVAHAGVPPELPRAMEELVNELSEPISFAVLNGNEAVIVERHEPQRPFAIHRDAERHLRLRHSSSGLVLLAFDHYASREMNPETEERIQSVRMQGYAQTHSEWLGDVVDAAAVPIMSGEKCLGALSVVAPEKRLVMEKAISALKATRARIEQQIAERLDNTPQSPAIAEAR